MKAKNLLLCLLMCWFLPAIDATAFLPVAIWFLDGTVVRKPSFFDIDSMARCIYYSKNNGRAKIAYFEEVFAITMPDDTLYFYYDKDWNLSKKDVFMILKGIDDGFRTRHYRNFIISFLLTYTSNVVLGGTNTVVRNIPSVLNFTAVAAKPVKPEGKSYYRLGYEVGLKRRKVLETTAGIVAGLYAYMATEALMQGGN